MHIRLLLWNPWSVRNKTALQFSAFYLATGAFISKSRVTEPQKVILNFYILLFLIHKNIV